MSPFTGLIAIPALFITPGDPVFSLPVLHLVVSAQGLRTAALVVLRVETAVTFTTVLVLCTPWNHILKSLRWLRLPAEVVTMVAMTHRYVFLLIETANQMFESRKSRTIGEWTDPDKRRMTARTAGVLLSKSIELSHDVYLAMVSRGFQGEVRVLTDFQMRLRDYFALTAFVLAACAGRVRQAPTIPDITEVDVDYFNAHPLMVPVDTVATLPLDAAAIQKGYRG